MTRNWRFWTFIVVLVIAHFTLHLGFGLGAAAPDLLTVALLLGARRLRASAAAALGLVLGVLRDALALTAFGASAVTLTVFAYAGARSRDLFVGDSLLFVGLYLFLGKWLHDVMFSLLARATGRGDVIANLLVGAPAAALYATIVGAAALGLYRALSRER